MRILRMHCEEKDDEKGQGQKEVKPVSLKSVMPSCARPAQLPNS